MKVLLAHELFPPDFRGGGEYVVYETARHLMGRGVEIQVLTTGDPDCREYDGIPTTRLPIHRYRLNAAVGPIVKMARQADLIHTFTYHACLPSWLAGKWTGRPVVCQVLALFGSTWLEMRGAWAGRAFMAFEKLILGRDFARTMFLAEPSRELGRRLGVTERRSVVNTPGIALDHYRSAPVKEDVVLFVGKLEARKGVHDLLSVAAALPHVRFRLMGWGAEEAACRRQATPNVEFVPFIRGAPLQEAFASARIFLFPSKAETLGIAVIEAMASGCAVVSSIPLPFEGVRVRAGDRAGMIDAVQKLWVDREATQRMGLANQERAKAYDWKRYTDVLLETYTQVLEEVRSARMVTRR